MLNLLQSFNVKWVNLIKTRIISSFDTIRIGILSLNINGTTTEPESIIDIGSQISEYTCNIYRKQIVDFISVTVPVINTIISLRMLDNNCFEMRSEE